MLARSLGEVESRRYSGGFSKGWKLRGRLPLRCDDVSLLPCSDADLLDLDVQPPFEFELSPAAEVAPLDSDALIAAWRSSSSESAVRSTRSTMAAALSVLYSSICYVRKPLSELLKEQGAAAVQHPPHGTPLIPSNSSVLAPTAIALGCAALVHTIGHRLLYTPTAMNPAQAMERSSTRVRFPYQLTSAQAWFDGLPEDHVPARRNVEEERGEREITPLAEHCCSSNAA